MGYSYRLHVHTELAADTPEEILAWLRGDGDGAAMIAAVRGTETRNHLSGLADWRPLLTTEVEAEMSSTGADPTPRVWRHRLALTGRIRDDDVLVVYGIAAMLAPYADEGMLGVAWTDMHQESDPLIFLVQQGRLYGSRRYSAPQHIALDGTEPVPWTPFPIGDPEADRPTT